VEPPLIEQIGDDDLVMVARDRCTQRITQRDPERRVSLAMRERRRADKDFAPCIPFPVAQFLTRIERRKLGFKLALAGKQFFPPLIERLARHRDPMEANRGKV
jgi:hypothetical protein